MEPIGAAASLITLLATARGIFNDGCDLYKAIEDAPNELRSVSHEATLVSSTLEQVLALRPRLDDGDAQLLPLDLRMSLALSLQMSYEALQKLKRLCSRTGDRGDLHLRLRWALLEKRAVREILKQLGKAEKDLALIIGIIQMHMSLFQSTSIRVVLAAQDALSQDMDRIRLNTGDCLNILTPSGRIEEVHDVDSPPVTAQISAQEQALPRALEEENAEIVPFLQQNKANRWLRSKSSGGANDWLQRLGISATFLWYWDQHQSTYMSTLKTSLPAIFGHRALIFELAVRRYALSWTNMSLLYGWIGISMMVPCTSKIFKACEEGDELTVRELIDSRHASPNDRCGECCCIEGRGLKLHKNEPLLFAAVRSGNISLVQYVLANGANVNALGPRLRSSLHMAFNYGLLDMARLLVNKGASLDHVDDSGRTVMHELCDYNYTVHGHCKYLKSTAFSKNHPTNHNWEHDIALPFVKYLLSMSFEDFDTPDDLHRTPQSYMAKLGASNVWSTLLRYGAGTCGTRKSFSYEMLYSAAYGGNTSIITSVLESDPPISLNAWDIPQDYYPLRVAAAMGHAAAVELLLDKGVAIEAEQNGRGRTALHVASSANNMEVVKLLLERGAHANCTDDQGSTPLRESVECVRRYSWFMNGPDYHLSTTFEPSSRLQEVSSCLLQYGADPHVVTWLTFNPLDRTGYLCTPTDAAKLVFVSDLFDTYVRVLAEHYAEVVVDTDRDVFWDAQEEIRGEGYGCSYESKSWWLEEVLREKKIESSLCGTGTGLLPSPRRPRFSKP